MESLEALFIHASQWIYWGYLKDTWRNSERFVTVASSSNDDLPFSSKNVLRKKRARVAKLTFGPESSMSEVQISGKESVVCLQWKC